MNPISTFEAECRDEIGAMGRSEELKRLTAAWIEASSAFKYTYHFKALGRPIIQYPQDIIAVQELIWTVRPTLIIETGIAHGGSLVLSAASLALLDYADAAAGEGHLDVNASKRRVIGIDIDVRSHNRAALDRHPMRHKLDIIEGSSIDPVIVQEVRDRVREDDVVMVFLDSNHTHDHVIAELESYAPLTSPGSYCVVFDTVIEHAPAGSFPNRPWGVGNNPKTAVQGFLARLQGEGTGLYGGGGLFFEIDEQIESKLMITVAPGGYLRRVGG